MKAFDIVVKHPKLKTKYRGFPFLWQLQKGSPSENMGVILFGPETPIPHSKTSLNTESSEMGTKFKMITSGVEILKTDAEMVTTKMTLAGKQGDENVYRTLRYVLMRTFCVHN